MKKKAIERLELLNYLFWKFPVLFVVTGFLFLFIGLAIGQRLWPVLIPCKTSPQPQGLKIELKTVPVEAQERPFCADAIKCIRDVGEELGKDNKVIMTMIRIAKKESTMNPKAKNPNSSASGLFQITSGTWKSNKCVGDIFNAENNIRCAYKIQAKRGYQPWEVCKTGKAQCYE